MRSSFVSGFAAMAGILGSSFGMALANPSASNSSKELFPQSKESKEFHLKRAADKRARKAANLHALAAAGTMEYSDRHLGIERELRPSGFILRNAWGEKIEPVSATFEAASSENNPDLNNYSVAQLLEIGRQSGLKVTTKMTKAKLIEVIQAG